MSGVGMLGGVLGGLALYLVGLWLVTEGAAAALGGVLTGRLASWGRSRWRAFSTGLGYGALLPSSGAQTQLSIGLVNTGMILLPNAAWLVVGSSLGLLVFTCAILALDAAPPVQPLGLFAIVAGVALHQITRKPALAPWGRTLIGAGVCLLGLQFIEDAFGMLLPGQRLDAFGLVVPVRVAIVFLFCGAASAAVRSASAVVAVVLFTTAAGALHVSSAIAALAGAQLGASAATAAIFSTGTADARRLALVHVTLHGAVALLELVAVGLAAPFIGALPAPFDHPMVALVSLHATAWAIVALAWFALVTPVTHWLQGHFAEDEGDPERVTRLDGTVLHAPAVAFECILRDLERLAEIARRLTKSVLGGERLSAFRIERDQATAASLSQSLRTTIGKLLSSSLSADLAERLMRISRASRDYFDCTLRAVSIHERDLARELAIDPLLRARAQQLRYAVLHLMDGSDVFRDGFRMSDCAGELNAIEGHARGLRTRMLSECNQGRASLSDYETVEALLAESSRIAQTAVGTASDLMGETAASGAGSAAAVATAR